MKALKLAGKILLILAGCVVLVFLGSLALNYRPGAVMGQRIDPGPIEALDGDAVRLSDFDGRVILIAFGTSG